ncbi:LysR family transcriptional regulator [Cupriavidus gilardii]|nr:LysR family transcriptional regulator [Cupriavidus gilardii]
MRRKLSFRHIETVHTIILTGSVTGAATRLHVTQPAISNVLRDAEERLGFLLFDRRGGRLVPTPGADMLFEEIEKSFIGLDAINAFCERIEQDQRQRISIACTPAFGATVLPRLAATYARQYPDIFFSVHSRVAHHVAALIGSRKADIGFALEVPDIPGVESELLAELPMVCYLPPGHRLARQAVVEPSQLLDEPMISLSRIEGIEDVVERLFETGQSGVPMTTGNIQARMRAQLVDDRHAVRRGRAQAEPDARATRIDAGKQPARGGQDRFGAALVGRMAQPGDFDSACKAQAALHRRNGDRLIPVDEGHRHRHARVRQLHVIAAFGLQRQAHAQRVEQFP